MKIHTYRLWLLLAASCAAGGAAARAAQTVPVPSPSALIRHAVMANGKLPYPMSATIWYRYTVRGGKTRLKREIWSVRANDKRHWCRLVPEGESCFVSGTTRIVCSAKTGKCTSPSTNAWELETVFGYRVTEAGDLLRDYISDPSLKPKLASVKVLEARLNGEPVYVLKLNRMIGTNLIAVGKYDSFIRRVEGYWPLMDTRLVYNIRIKHEAKPFPASTFIRHFAGKPGRVEPPSITQPPTPLPPLRGQVDHGAPK